MFFLDNQQKGEILQFKRREVLQGARQVSRDQMERKVLREYAAYYARQLKLPEAM